MNLETGKTVSRRRRGRSRKARQARRPLGRCRSCRPDGADRGRATRAPTDNKDRWLVAVDPETGATRVVDALHDDAWVREVGGFGPNDPSFGWLPDQKHLWFLSERDGWMHLYTVDRRRREPGARSS